LSSLTKPKKSNRSKTPQLKDTLMTPKPTKKEKNNRKYVNKSGNKPEPRRKNDHTEAAIMAAATVLARGHKPIAVSRPKSRKTAQPGNLPTLSMAAAKYAAAILNPRSALAQDAYIPVGNGRPSYKTRTINRFDMVIGTNGIGWVALAPCLASDCVVAWYTGVAYAGTSVIPYASAALGTLNAGVSTAFAPTGTQLANLLLPYTTEGIGATPSGYGRVVSASMTVSYIGTTLAEGGLLYCFTDPAHNSIVSSTVDTLGARNETDVSNISRMKCENVDFSFIDVETNFDRTVEYAAAAAVAATDPSQRSSVVVAYPFSSASTPGPDSLGLSAFAAALVAGQPTSVVLASGTAGNKLHIEIIQHIEYVGASFEGRTTPSPVDRLGYETVSSGLGNAMQLLSSPSITSLSQAFVQGCKVSSNAMMPVSSTTLMEAIGVR